VPQDGEEIPTPEILTAMSTQAQEIRRITVALSTEVKSLKAQVATMNSTISIADLRANIAELEENKKTLGRRVEGLKAQRECQMKAEESGIASVKEDDGVNVRKKIEEEMKTWQGIKGRRQTIENDLWDVLLGSIPPGKSMAEYKVSPRHDSLPCQLYQTLLMHSVIRKCWDWNNDIGEAAVGVFDGLR
jgi:septum formation inhibitor MinC